MSGYAPFARLALGEKTSLRLWLRKCARQRRTDQPCSALLWLRRIPAKAGTEGAGTMGHLIDSPWKIFILFVIPALICVPLGNWKNQWWRGLLTGLVLSWLGVLIFLLIPVSDEARIRREQTRQRIQD